MNVIVTEFVLDLRLICAIWFALVLFGVLFNILINHLGEHKAGYTAFLVVFGVLITLLGVALVNWLAALVCLGAFAASGTPMIVGDVARYIRVRKAAMDRQRAEMPGE